MFSILLVQLDGILTEESRFDYAIQFQPLNEKFSPRLSNCPE